MKTVLQSNSNVNDEKNLTKESNLSCNGETRNVICQSQKDETIPLPWVWSSLWSEDTRIVTILWSKGVSIYQLQPFSLGRRICSELQSWCSQCPVWILFPTLKGSMRMCLLATRTKYYCRLFLLQFKEEWHIQPSIGLAIKSSSFPLGNVSVAVWTQFKLRARKQKLKSTAKRCCLSMTLGNCHQYETALISSFPDIAELVKKDASIYMEQASWKNIIKIVLRD